MPARKEEQFCTSTGQKLYRYSVNAREKEHFCIGSKVITVQVQCKREGKGTLLYRVKSDMVQCKREGKGTLLYRVKSDPIQCRRSLS